MTQTEWRQKRHAEPGPCSGSAVGFGARITPATGPVAAGINRINSAARSYLPNFFNHLPCPAFFLTACPGHRRIPSQATISSTLTSINVKVAFPLSQGARR
jgi:hypothetical protein